MKILIAIASCHSMRHYQDSQRSTWVKDIPSGVDFRYFLGNPKGSPEPDEIFLDVADDYAHCTAKTIHMARWEMEHGYDHVFKTDLDTLVRPVQMLSSDFWQHDYVGGLNGAHLTGTPGSGRFASGGSGYWLSRRALSIIAEQEPPSPPRPDEDVVVSSALGHNGIELHADTRYKWAPNSRLDSNTFTLHLTSALGYGTVTQLKDGVVLAAYTPDVMGKVYRDGSDAHTMMNRRPQLTNIGSGRPLRRFR